jgi:hypothetical protein
MLNSDCCGAETPEKLSELCTQINRLADVREQLFEFRSNLINKVNSLNAEYQASESPVMEIRTEVGHIPRLIDEITVVGDTVNEINRLLDMLNAVV